MSPRRKFQRVVFAAAIFGISTIFAVSEQVKEAQEKMESKEIVADFSGETVSAEPVTFVPAVGTGLSARMETIKCSLWMGGNGRRAKPLPDWRIKRARSMARGTPSSSDNVKAYAYFPFAVFKDVQDFKEGEITVRFKPIAGRIDQGAGILFNLKPNGDYLIVRANALENNWFCSSTCAASEAPSNGFATRRRRRNSGMTSSSK